jgi:hypothetical protein
MKEISALFFILILAGCKNNIDTKIKGLVYINSKTPAKNITIETRVVLAPMKSLYSKRTDLVLKKNGEFEFEIKRKELKGDHNFTILITKKGYEDTYRFVDIINNREIDLDTIFLKPTDSIIQPNN